MLRRSARAGGVARRRGAPVDGVYRQPAGRDAAGSGAGAIYTFGIACGFDRKRLLQFAEESLPCNRQRPARRRRRRRIRARARRRRCRYGNRAGDERHAAVAARARLGSRGAAPRVRGFRDSCRRHRGEHHVANRGGACPASTRSCWSWRSARVRSSRSSRQRRRFLAGQGILQDDRAETVATWTILETIVSVLGLVGVLLLGLLIGSTAYRRRRDTSPMHEEPSERRASVASRVQPSSVDEMISVVTDKDSLRMLIVDAHLDLAMNAIEWNRDLVAGHRRHPCPRTRADRQARSRQGHRVVRGDAARTTSDCASRTQIARYAAREHPYPGWHSQEQAWAMTQAQLAWYRAMEERGELLQIRDAASTRRSSRRSARQRGERAHWLRPEPRGR